MKRITNKKAQLSMEEAPAIVLIVGLLFLTMATIAFIGEKYGNVLDTDNTLGIGINESGTRATLITTGITLDASSLENGVCSSLTNVFNGTGGVSIGSGNFSLTSACILTNTSSMETFGATTYLVNYAYTYSAPTVSSNVTSDLETEISNNTSIAGIVLTISLVGIVLTILIGVFIGIRRTRI